MRFAVPAYVLGIALLVAVALFGDIVNGARRWLHVGVDALPALGDDEARAAAHAGLVLPQQRGDAAPARLRASPRCCSRCPFGLIVRQPDLGTAALVGAVGLLCHLLRRPGWKVMGGARACSALARLFPLLGHAARLPAQARPHAARPDAGSARRGLPHHPVDHRGGLGRPRRQGLAERHADAPRVHPRAPHRLHLRGVLRGVRPDRQPAAAGALRAADRARPDDRRQRRHRVRAPARRRR